MFLGHHLISLIPDFRSYPTGTQPASETASMEPPAQTLGIPNPGPTALSEVNELVQNIFSHLWDCPDTLRNAIISNRRFSDLAIDVLWAQGVIPSTRLTHLSRARLKFYAQKIVSFAISSRDNPRQHNRFSGIQFTRLKHLYFEGCYFPNPTRIEQYIYPTLATLQLVEKTIVPRILQRIMVTCHRIREIHVSAPEALGGRVTPALFRRFLEGSPTIERMHFASGMDRLFTEELWLHLAARTNLMCLGTDAVGTAQVLRRIAQSVPYPFRRLELLAIGMQSASVDTLVEMFPYIERLSVFLRDYTSTVIPELGSLHMLCQLTVSFPHGVQLLPSEIVPLKRLSLLEDLRLIPESPNSANYSDFNDNNLRRLLRRLPHLRVFKFGAYNVLRDAFEVAGRDSYGNLEHFSIPHSNNLLPFDLRSRGIPLFRKLRCLKIGAFRGFSAPE